MLDSYPITTAVPSLPFLCRYIFRLLSTHPLIINPPIYHPVTGERVYIKGYKLFNGIETNLGLYCSIFPHSTPTDGISLPKPADTSTSVLFEPQGNGYDLAVYHIALKLHYNFSILGNKETNNDLIAVPLDAAIHPSQTPYAREGSRELELYYSPSLYIIGEYLELIRLAILDKEHTFSMPSVFRTSDIPRNIQVLYFNLKTPPWEKDKALYFHEGEILIRIDSILSKEWKSQFEVPTASFQVSVL
jgi:hypothetical protein